MSPTERLAVALADRYRIEAEVGSGGMATVYLAHDVKHNRKVALKVLRPELGAIIGAERFLKEIEVTANLQHPNILPLYDSGRVRVPPGDPDEGTGGEAEYLYYVMPYVEGESLRVKLNRERQLPVGETIEIAKSVGAALDYAHERGVVHRDIKPENILLQAGQALVADFGIALAISQAGGTRLTETGLSLGTPHYMSPEQAAGDRAIDARSDLYSLGATVYEMLVGEPPHVGNSVQAIVAKILSDTPAPITRSRELVPPNVDAAVQRALARSPADRFANAAGFTEALTDPTFALPTGASRLGVAKRRAPWKVLSMGLAGLSVALTAFSIWALSHPRPQAPVSRQRIVLGTADTPGLVAYGTAMAPDGSAIVYTDTVGGSLGLWLKERDQARATPLAKTSQFPPGPSFSPDGKWIAFGNGRLMKVPRGGGVATIVSDSAALEAGAWLDDGTIVFPGSNADRLYRTVADGGPTVRVTATDSVDAFYYWVHPLPRSRGVLFSAFGGTGASDVWVLDLANDEARVLIAGASSAWYLPPGRVLYARPDGGVFQAPIDLDALEITGPSLPVLEGVQTVQGVAELQVTPNGTLLYATGEATGVRGHVEFAWIGRDGATTAVDTAWRFGAPPNGGLALAPDGARLAFSVVDSLTNASDIYIKRMPTGLPSRLTFEGSQNIRPAWSPDGAVVLFSSNRGGQQDLWAKRADGSERARPLLARGERAVWEGLWSPDGQWLVYRTDDIAAGRGDILGVRLGEDTIPVELVATEAEETSPALSPDGRWLAYASDLSGRKEVYVRPFPSTDEGMWQVSTDGGVEPIWAHSGRELFYRNAQGRVVAAEVSTVPTFEVGARHVLFDARPYMGNDDNHYYAVSQDDRRQLMVRSVGTPAGTERGDLILVENWLQELDARAGGG